MQFLLPGQYRKSKGWAMSEALKLITATLASLFLGDLNILMGTPSDILASQFLIIISSDFYLYLLVLLVTLRILSSPAIVPSLKLLFMLSYSGTPIATIIGSH